MTQEEFKQTILSQFKQGNAPIHTLMLNTTLRRAHYLDQMLFKASEFNLNVHVDTVDDEEGKFQVMFIDQQDLAENLKKGFSVPDLTGIAVWNDLYVLETVSIFANSITFTVKMFGLSSKQYVYDINTAGFDLYVHNYDVLNGRFSGADSTEGFKSLCDSYRLSGHWHYVDAALGPKFFLELNEMLDSNNIHGVRRETIMDAFDISSFKTLQSTISQILTRLT